MRQLHIINRYIAFKLKELEFRVRMWRRAKEISRAYGDTGISGARGKFKFEININYKAITPYAVKGAKISAALAALVLLVLGLTKAIPYLSVLAASVDKPSAEAEKHDVDAGDSGADAPPELPEGAVLPEAAVMPEGYAENALTATGAAAQQPPQQVGTTPQAASPALSGKPLADVFKAGLPRGISDYVILVDKAAKVMYLFRGAAGGWEVVRSYVIATGERAGPKRIEGDKKTPQGEYFIVGRKHRSELTNLYGPAAFILDYPNESDRQAGRTGHGIWIHGSERGNIEPLFTQGCVAVSNPDILDLAGVLQNWAGVPVIIVSGEEDAKAHLAAVDFRRLRSKRAEAVRHHAENQAEFEKLVADWKAAWESKDIDAYTAFYSTATFANGTQRWDAYRAHKLGTFAMYASINIDLNNIALTELTENSATVKFSQTYATNLNKMENGKRLIFRKEQGSWKIHREIPFPKEELL